MQIDKVISFIKSQKNGFFLIEIKTDHQSEIMKILESLNEEEAQLDIELDSLLKNLSSSTS